MSDRKYFRPIPQVDIMRPEGAFSLAGGWAWFTHAEVLSRAQPPFVVPAADIPRGLVAHLTAPRTNIAGMAMSRPFVMGILNATPDSFSDGGDHAAASDAIAAGLEMQRAGADIVDVGGESTRPGSQEVDAVDETRRTVPVIEGLRAAGMSLPISIDTRKTEVAAAAVGAGASLVNDVSGFTFDADLAPLCAERELPVCVMHGPADPATMQSDPKYDNVVLDVFDFLEERIEVLEATGISRSRIIADPGIGFGKTLQHNLTLLSRISLFHALGVPILLGASRKRFIGTIGGAEVAKDRVSGSLGVALAAMGHGVQGFRVHDVAQTVQAIALWRAAMMGEQA